MGMQRVHDAVERRGRGMNACPDLLAALRIRERDLELEPGRARTSRRVAGHHRAHRAARSAGAAQDRAHRAAPARPRRRSTSRSRRRAAVSPTPPARDPPSAPLETDTMSHRNDYQNLADLHRRIAAPPSSPSCRAWQSTSPGQSAGTLPIRSNTWRRMAIAAGLRSCYADKDDCDAVL